MSDRASQALAEGVPPGLPRTFDAMSKRSNVPLSTLHHRAHGRPSIEEKARNQQYLTPCEEKAVVEFMLQMDDLGQPVRIKYLPQLAFSITRRRPMADRPSKPPGRNWPQAFQKRHPELTARRFRALDWNRHDINIYDKIKDWFEVIRRVLDDPSILPENVYNMDETGIMLSMLGSVKVLVSKDDRRGYRGARVKRTTVTAIECISADGRCLKPMIIWPASTHRANWTTHPTPGWVYACSDSGFTDSYISLQWLMRVFDPQTKEQANQKPRVLIWDGFGAHETLEILEFCFANNIILCRIPSHTSHKLQPCDIAVFGPLKAAYRDQVERLERGGVGTIGKEHFTYLYSPARERALTSRNIKAGFRASGLFPLDPDRVLTDMPKPLAELTIPAPNASVVEVGPYPQCEILQTPVTSEGLTLLSNLIKQDANAAQTSFAKNALLQDRTQFLIKINNESKARRSTASVVLGKAKVMSYEDLEEARAKRAEKDAAEEAKGKRKRDRKPKNGVPEGDDASADKENRGRKRKSTTEDADPPEPKAKKARVVELSEAARAPVAQMIEAPDPANTQ